MNVKKFLYLLLYLTIISQTGCSSKPNDTVNIVQDINEENNDNNKTEDKNSSEIVNNSEFNNFINLFNNYKINYNYQEYLISKEEVDNIYNLLSKENLCNYVNDKNVEEIYKMILNNSVKYCLNNLIYDFCFSDVDDVKLKDIFMLVIDEHFNTSINNINEDLCKMQDLAIVYDYSEEDLNLFGWYDVERNIICLCPNSIKSYADILLARKGLSLNKEDYNVFLSRCYYNVLSHEFEHMYHYSCDCNGEEYDYMTVFSSSKREDGKYYFSLNEEASSESIFINFDREENLLYYDEKINITNYDYVYLNERSEESLFWLLSLFNNESDINNYYKAIEDTNINLLLDFFDMNNDVDRYNYYKILYTLDGIRKRSDLLDKYEKDFGIIETSDDYNQYVNNIGSGYRAEIFRVFLSRLVKYTDLNKDFTIEENLLLFNFVKDKIVDANYGDNYVWDENFVNDILFLEENYVKFLSDFYKVSYDNVRNLEMEIDKYNLMMLDTNSLDGNYIASNLFKRFPMLEIIVKSTSFPIGYDWFLKENTEKNFKKILK